jgi:hypothetical protein
MVQQIRVDYERGEGSLATWKICRTTPVGLEPTRGDPIDLAGRRINRSAKVSLKHMEPCYYIGYAIKFVRVCTHVILIIQAAQVAFSRKSLQQAAGCLV